MCVLGPSRARWTQGEVGVLGAPKYPAFQYVYRAGQLQAKDNLKPSYLCGIVSYEVDQVIIFHKLFAEICFPVSKTFLAIIFDFNFNLSKISKLKLKLKMKMIAKKYF